MRAQLFGHFHSDEFRVEPGCAAPPILIASAITPIYANAPSFRVFEFDDSTFALRNYEQYVLDPAAAAWRLLYNSNDLFPSLGCEDLTATAASGNLTLFAHTVRFPVVEDVPAKEAAWRCLVQKKKKKKEEEEKRKRRRRKKKKEERRKKETKGKKHSNEKQLLF